MKIMDWEINIQKQKEFDFISGIPSWFQPIPENIQKFAPLLAEFGKYYSKIKFQKLNILELGPGIKIQLAQFLLTKFSSLQLTCVAFLSIIGPFPTTKEKISTRIFFPCLTVHWMLSIVDLY